MPSAPPIVRPITGAQRPTTSDMRAPWISRESSSRPSPSVPSQCAAENAARRSSMSISVGLGSGRKSAKIATANTSTTQPIAAQNSGPSLRPRFGGCTWSPSSSVSSSVAMTNPGVEDGVEQIDDEVHDDEAGSDQKHHALEDYEVAGADRADQKPADSGQRQHRLDNDAAADQPADIDAGDRHQRQRRRVQSMHDQDARRRQ